jgi:HSP20 family protein
MTLRSILPAGQRRLPAGASQTDPFTAIRREMERMFDDLSGGWVVPNSTGTSILAPNVNVSETSKGLQISVELPGVDQKDIEVDLADGILTLKAERHAEKDEQDEKQHYHIVERSYGTLLRRFALPFEADATKVEASLDKGVLHVFVPRQQPAEKPKTKIAIKSNAK